MLSVHVAGLDHQLAVNSSPFVIHAEYSTNCEPTAWLYRWISTIHGLPQKGTSVPSTVCATQKGDLLQERPSLVQTVTYYYLSGAGPDIPVRAKTVHARYTHELCPQWAAAVIIVLFASLVLTWPDALPDSWLQIAVN